MIGTLDVPGARLHYEVRGSGPVVLLVAAPMDATSFAPLADLFADDYTVITTDPRGINRSTVDNPDQDSTPQMRADDVLRLLKHLGADAATVFGSSGGAVSALALAECFPGQVRAVIAHEPPLLELLPDRVERHARNEEVIALWVAGDRVGSWKAFLDNADIHLPEEVFQQVFAAEPSPQAVADSTFQNLHMLRSTTHWQPDIAALRSGTTRVVVGIGEQSAGQVCDRASRALAARLGVEPAMFPGGHTGFAEDPDAFAPRLRAVLRDVMS